jgi:hypothetical protein
MMTIVMVAAQVELLSLQQWLQASQRLVDGYYLDWIRPTQQLDCGAPSCLAAHFHG